MSHIFGTTTGRRVSKKSGYCLQNTAPIFGIALPILPLRNWFLPSMLSEVESGSLDLSSLSIRGIALHKRVRAVLMKQLLRSSRGEAYGYFTASMSQNCAHPISRWPSRFIALEIASITVYKRANGPLDLFAKSCFFEICFVDEGIDPRIQPPFSFRHSTCRLMSHSTKLSQHSPTTLARLRLETFGMSSSLSNGLRDTLEWR